MIYDPEANMDKIEKAIDYMKENCFADELGYIVICGIEALRDMKCPIPEDVYDKIGNIVTSWEGKR